MDKLLHSTLLHALVSFLSAIRTILVLSSTQHKDFGLAPKQRQAWALRGVYDTHGWLPGGRRSERRVGHCFLAMVQIGIYVGENQGFRKVVRNASICIAQHSEGWTSIVGGPCFYPKPPFDHLVHPPKEGVVVVVVVVVVVAVAVAVAVAAAAAAAVVVVVGKVVVGTKKHIPSPKSPC